MSFLDPKQESEAIEQAVLKQVSSMFPYKGRGGGGRTLELRGLRVGQSADPGDIRGQKRAKLYGRTWATPVYADLELKEGDKVIDRQEIKIMSLPKTTALLSYIVNGKEVHIEGQWHLRPGAYARETADGQLEVQFNPRGPETRIQFNPESRVYNMEYGKSQNVPLYSVLHSLGVDHENMVKAWGSDIAEANRAVSNPRVDLPKLYKGIYGEPPADGTTASALKGIAQKFASAELSPEVTSITLGKPKSAMDGDTFLLASKRLLAMSRGESQPDARDAIHFKELWGLEDFIPFRLQESKRSIERKIGNNLSRKDSIREILDSSTFGKPMLGVFGTSLAVAPNQTNPVDIISSQRKTTSMGPMGGIESEHKIKLDMRLVDNSHIGFIDPIPTPEGCYDPETEVFTSEGWVRWPSVTESTTFACLVDERLEFHQAEAIQRLPFSGDLLGVKTAVMEYLVTPAHRVLWRPWEERSPTCRTWRVDRADDVQHRWASKYRMTHGRLIGDDVTHFELPEVTGNNSSVRVPPIAIGDWAEFLGWYLSEGETTYNEATSIYHVTLYQSSTMSPRECRLIESLLRRLPFTWSCATDQATGKNTYTIAVKQLASYMAQFGKQQSRFIPDCMLTAPWHARGRLLGALLPGDGRLGNHGGTQRVYTTTSARLASDVERLMISLGSAVSVRRYADNREERYRDVYEVRALKSTETVAIKSKGHYQTVPFEGTVYCATVPGGMLYVRRNGGRPIWSGNSMTGITLSLPVGTSKSGRNVMTNAYNTRTGKMERITPNVAVGSVVAFPDQFAWENGKPVATSPLVQASAKGNDFTEVAPGDVDYILPSAQGMFTVSTNMIPFMQNDHGNRANFASKQITQAIALDNPEQPLVQVHTGYGDPTMTWERVLGMKFSSKAPEDGVVESIGPDAVMIRTANGKLREVQHYDNYPLNDGKSHISSIPVVAVGDKVKAGQLLTDSNFTRGGTLAYGINATVGYLALPGSTFEDGIVISDTMAKKLSSTHMYQEKFTEERPITLNKEKFRAYMPLALTAEQAAKLDDSGVIKPGTKVNYGDTLVAALRESEQGEEQRILQGISKKLARPYSNASLVWDNEAPGEVVEVIRNGRDIQVQIKTVEAAQVADKLTGRHGNKGVISRVLPDAEMPRRADGTRLDIVINPMAVGARMNPGQIYETLMSKVAEKRGGPIAVTNFASNPDKQFVDVAGHWRTIRNKDGSPIKRTWVEPHQRSYYRAVMRELEREGLSDKEPLFDARTGEELHVAGEKGGVLVGKQYILKLEHMASKKLSARGTGAGYEYDANLAPKGGGHEGAQRLGILGLYAILAHEKATNLLQEMQTIKSDRSQSDYWLALMSNEALPPMQVPFAYDKFMGYLKQLGVKVERTGSELRLLPRTDKEVLAASNGEVDPSKIMTAKDMEPEEGGIFDEKITGGKGGTKWAHHKLGAPVMNPMFGQAVANILGLTQKAVEEIASAEKGITIHGSKYAIVPAGEAAYVGGDAIKAMLSSVDAKKMLADAERDLPSATKSRVDDLVKRIRFLRPLVEKGVSPVDAYVMHNLPIMPPRLHPLAVLPSGDINWDDINGLYKQIGIISTTLRDMPEDLPEEYSHPLRADLYDGVKAIMGLGGKQNGPDGYKGVLDIIAGSNPKNGYFARALFSRKQDLSMRAVIVPGEDLSLDEVGLPRLAAMSLFEPFVVRELVKLGYTPNEARQAVKDHTDYAERALDYVVSTRPVLLKRDPALHKFSVMAFKPKLIPGKAIHIHPLATGGFNADFDGDAMSVYVPVTDGAVREAYQMLPSRNLFNEASGTTMYQPSLESQLGLYAVSRWGEDKGKKFADPNQLLMAAKQRLLPYDEVVSLAGTRTTAGRVLLNSLMPKAMRDGPLLTSPSMELDKSGLQKLMAEVAEKQPTEFAEFIDKFKDIGFQHTYKTGSSISMEDLRPLSQIRDAAMAKADGAVLRAMKDGMTGSKLSAFRVEAYGKATEEISAQAKAHFEKTGNVFYKMGKAGTKPSWDQLRQMVIAPILLSDGHGRTIEVPVRNAFSDGLSVSEYWIASHGARKGIIQKTGEVQQPGALNKKISATVVNMVVTADDCGARRGILLPSSSKEIMDRYLSESVKAPGLSLQAGTLVTPAIASQIRSAGIDKIPVRSPLRCQATDGLCGKCYGVHKNGKAPGLRENIGMMAGQSVGERATQLVLKAFHSGGIAGSKSLPSIDRLEQILNVYNDIPRSATLATQDSQVRAITKDPAGGWRVKLDSAELYVPQDRGAPTVKVGDMVKKGHPLSEGPINPRELLELSGLESVQSYMTKAMEDVYKGEGLRRRNFEVVVKSLTNLAQIEDPGGHPDWLRTDLVPASKVAAWNRENPTKPPIKFKTILKGLETAPLSGTEDWLSRMNFEQLKKTVQSGAMRGWKSDLHGTSPVPGLVFGAEFGKSPTDRPWSY